MFLYCSHVKDGAIRAKLESLVEFPLNGLDMNPYLEKRTLSKSCSSLPRDGYPSQAALSRVNSQILPPEGIPDKRKVTTKKTLGNTLMRKLSRSPNSATLKLPTGHTTGTTVSKENNIYDLYAVCNHTGNMNRGHYTAFCRNYRDGQWYLYDDNQVSPICESKVITTAAYMLFYSRRTSTHHRMPHWSYSVAKDVLFSAVATRSHGSHLLGGGQLPPKKRLESTSSLPATQVTGRKISESSMSVPPIMTDGGRSLLFSPQMNTVREMTIHDRFPHHSSHTSNESVVHVTSPHQKSHSYDHQVNVTSSSEYHRRSRSFEQPIARDSLSPARSDLVKEKLPDYSWSYHSHTLPPHHRNNTFTGSLRLPQSGTETCV